MWVQRWFIEMLPHLKSTSSELAVVGFYILRFIVDGLHIFQAILKLVLEAWHPYESPFPAVTANWLNH